MMVTVMVMIIIISIIIMVVGIGGCEDGFKSYTSFVIYDKMMLINKGDNGHDHSWWRN